MKITCDRYCFCKTDMYIYMRLGGKEVSPTITIGALLDIAAADIYIDSPLHESYMYTFINGSAHGPVGFEKNRALRVCLSSNYCRSSIIFTTKNFTVEYTLFLRIKTNGI